MATKGGVIRWLGVHLILVLCFISTAFADLTPEQQAARERGLVLYQQSDWYDSQPLLLVAAQAGDQQAQYYLAEAIRLSNRYMTDEARRWYEAAAEQGDLFAMLRLSNSSDLCHQVGTCGPNAFDWRSKALDTAYERAEQGDTEAMRALFNAGQGIGWLEKAAEGGDAPAQRLLAGLYRDGEGWFLLPGRRQQAIEKWYRASAEGGFPLGMMHYANYLDENNGSKEEIAYWIKKAAEAGYITAVSSYAYYLAHMPNAFNYPKDMIAAYGLTYLISRLEGGGFEPDFARRETLPSMAEKMTSEQIEEAKVFAAEWERTHPPLSFFVPVYGY